MSLLNAVIKSPLSEIFRFAEIKRRSIITGLFEDTWQDVSKDVKKWGKVSIKLDDVKLNKFTFANTKIVFSNEDGLYSPHTDENSLWYGYLNQQRSLVRIKAGYYYRQQREDGVWINGELPSETVWDSSVWDGAASIWDGEISSYLFTGIISGDIPVSDNNEVTFNLKPLVSVLQDFPAKNLTGWTTGGMTASQFVTMVMNQTDGSSNYVFLPFFGNTTSYWEISTTSTLYTDLTSTSVDITTKTVWEVIEKLAEAENYIPYVTREGIFRFVSRDIATTTVAWEFHGAGSFNTEYGQTIKKLNAFGPKQSKYYSRIQVKFVDEDTVTSYHVVQGSFSVSPLSTAWVLGERTLKLENFYIPNTTTASTIATNIFNEYSSQKNEIEFTTTFIPHLDPLDKISIFYDPSEININSLWDQRDWAADDTNTATDLIFDAAAGDPINLSGDEFKFLSIEIDVDNLECKYIAREI